MPEHIFSLQSIIKSWQNESKKTLVTSIDFSKSFDCVNRDQLVYKLIHAGVEGKMYFIIKSLYDQTKSKVRIINCTTSWFDTESGERQGDCMSPTLFSIFVIDLATRINTLKLGINLGTQITLILLQADKVAILAENEEDMQTMLNEINDWCIEWNIKVNISKTKVMDCRKQKTEKTEYKFKIGENTVEMFVFYKYLTNLRALGAVIAKYKNFNDMGHKTY